MIELKREVCGEGPSGQILCVGEAPSWEELKQGRPFVGPAGRVFRNALSRTGITANCRVENVIERKLQDNNIDSFYGSGGLPNEELAAWYQDLHTRISATQPKVIVPLGDTALRAVLNNHSLKISDIQSYVLTLQINNQVIPVIPAYHPAFIFRQPDFGFWLDLALNKAKEINSGRSIDPEPTCIINPTFDEVIGFLNRARWALRLSIDIETTKKTHEITMIGITIDEGSVGMDSIPSVTMCIPFAKQFLEPYWTEEQEKEIWYEIAKTLGTSGPTKIFQNFIFDTMYLRRFGIETKGPIEDTLIRANLLNPELPKSLADLGRIYCFCAPWKSTKDFNLSGNPDDLYRYNATDAARTLQIYTGQTAEINIRGFSEFYTKYVKPLSRPVLEACSAGIAVNVTKLNRFKTELAAAITPIEEKLISFAAPLLPPKTKQRKVRNKEHDEKGISEKTGKQIILKKAYTTVEERTPQKFNPRSNDQVKTVLGVLGYRIPTKKGKESSDRESLIKLNRKQPSAFISHLLMYGKLQKIVSSYISLTLDPDDRCRFAYNKGSNKDEPETSKGGTRSGRFSCGKTPWDTGLNIQTIPRKSDDVPVNIKELFIPAASCSFLEVDLSQAELRVVAWLSGDPTLNDLLDRNEDVHQYVADLIEKQTGIVCPRQLGKRVNHAKNYGMGPQKFADSCLTEANIVLSVDDARKLLDTRDQAFPFIAQWNRQIAEQLHKTRSLVSPHGRQRYFFGPAVTDDMIREALSFIPQATVVDTINLAWLCLEAKRKDLPFRIVAQIHDSLLIEYPTNRLDQMIAEIDSTFSSLSVTINGIRRQIPWDCKIGSNWGEMKKYGTKD